MENIILLGAGGHGRDVLDAARQQGHHVAGFLDEVQQLHGTFINNVPVLGSLEWLLEHRDHHAFIAVGSPAVKQKFANFLSKHHLLYSPSIIHPRAYISDEAQIGIDNIILAGSVIQPQVTVHNHIYISTVCTLGHDVLVEDFVSIHPGVQIGGEVKLKVGCFVGIGATILPRLTLGEWSTVGAGAVVTKDVPPYTTVLGVPARIVKIEQP